MPGLDCFRPLFASANCSDITRLGNRLSPIAHDKPCEEQEPSSDRRRQSLTLGRDEGVIMRQHAVMGSFFFFTESRYSTARKGGVGSAA